MYESAVVKLLKKPVYFVITSIALKSVNRRFFLAASESTIFQRRNDLCWAQSERRCEQGNFECKKSGS